VKLFNREPALWLGLIAIVVKLAAAFGVDVSAEQQAVINAVAAAAVGFGLDWSAEQQAVVLAAASAVVAMWDRTQITAPAPATAVAPVRSV
jgi:hypothetical protein